MKKKITALFITLSLLFTVGCGTSVGKNDQTSALESHELADGCYQIAVALSGGSGRASVQTPAKLRVENGKAVVTIVWSSANYDYMIVDNVTYEPISTEGHSVFEIPIAGFDGDMPVTADTVAMSEPHEINYTLRFDSATLAAGADREAS